MCVRVCVCACVRACMCAGVHGYVIFLHLNMERTYNYRLLYKYLVNAFRMLLAAKLEEALLELPKVCDELDDGVPMEIQPASNESP